MTALSILAFAGLCLVLALTPGPDTFLVLRFSMGRARDGLAAAAGCAAGSLVWAALVAIGLATLLEQSAELFRVVKIVGGVYLVFLGVMAFVSTRRGARRSARRSAGGDGESAHTAHPATPTPAFPTAIPTTPATTPAAPSRHPRITRTPWPSLLAGLLSTLLNPKVGLFFLAVVPQFVSARAGFGETMLLGAVDAVIGGLYLVAVTVLASRLVAWLRRPRVTRALERVSAGVLAALGIGTVVAGAEG